MEFFENNELLKELSRLYEQKKEIEDSITRFAYNPVARDRLYNALKKTNFKIRTIKQQIKRRK